MSSFKKSSTDQLAVYGVDELLRRQLLHNAQLRGISIDRYVIELLREGVGLTSKTETAYDDLDELWGTWDSDEADEFDAFLESTNQIDTAFWQ